MFKTILFLFFWTGTAALPPLGIVAQGRDAFHVRYDSGGPRGASTGLVISLVDGYGGKQLVLAIDKVWKKTKKKQERRKVRKHKIKITGGNK